MFHVGRDSSKVALAHLVKMAKVNHFELIDCQLTNEHLRSLGAVELSRAEFLERLARGGVNPSDRPPGGKINFPPGGYTDW
jgi:leucyl/phenylalanyl-tRNA--protein transferase